ncbi:MAG: hypothetical protein DI601_06370 [Azospirillum brasilense]|nr:MAG: hypothetical protein DI601_06370 [Azospirillum brasilense]PZR08545.1 MAG: hypothetical protein DI532_21565 [Azospirillum brasilense]
MSHPAALGFALLKRLPSVVRACEDLVHVDGVTPEVVGRRLYILAAADAEDLVAALRILATGAAPVRGLPVAEAVE